MFSKSLIICYCINSWFLKPIQQSVYYVKFSICVLITVKCPSPLRNSLFLFLLQWSALPLWEILYLCSYYSEVPFPFEKFSVFVLIAVKCPSPLRNSLFVFLLQWSALPLWEILCFCSYCSEVPFPFEKFSIFVLIAVKCPSPLKNRDFVMQRTWLETRDEFIIFNHSIYHKVRTCLNFYKATKKETLFYGRRDLPNRVVRLGNFFKYFFSFWWQKWPLYRSFQMRA